ncbi:tyrosine-protein phosphatase [Halalkalibacter hemicellulosilyticus]|uniref:Protein-tyrosine phosphatase-like protein n=1 Tax=Halalkalibacter hemicellulosilyticusJCM 9152 TaxID=1236971 RepID=W4QH79_9BACI|nr:tyrosine-protein phosphatase [Halalkalibacter hemicellulosilyticus]GAE31421.1 protein-tyrosine phosphatase-like protein [Halalkalibacter hemicellulosilyticusJCM 9152]
MNVQQPNRLIEFTGTFNFRDLGGYETTDGRRVKWGKIFRSGNISMLDEQDMRQVQQLGVTAICDLRADDELERFPTPFMEFIQLYHVPVIPSNGEEEYRQALDLTEEFVKRISKPGDLLTQLNEKMTDHTKAYRKVFDVLLEEEGAVLFHCMAGKDRTGVMAALILSVLNVPREIIVEDYLYTNRSSDRLKQSLATHNHEHIKKLDTKVVEAMLEARTEYIEAFFKKIDQDYGNVYKYMTNAIGLSEAEIQLLQEKLLERV